MTRKIAALSLQIQTDYERAMAEFRLNGALEAAWRLVARMNKYIDEKAPWGLAKAANNGEESAKAELATVLTTCLESVRVTAILAQPFLPVAAPAILTQLGIADLEKCVSLGKLEMGRDCPPERKLALLCRFFPRIAELTVEDKALMTLSAPANNSREKESNVTETNVTEPNAAPVIGAPVAPAETPDETKTAPITIDDFMKVHLKVAEILAAEPVPNATKLLRLTVQAGEDDTPHYSGGHRRVLSAGRTGRATGCYRGEFAAPQNARHRIAGDAARRRP